MGSWVLVAFKCNGSGNSSSFVQTAPMVGGLSRTVSRTPVLAIVGLDFKPIRRTLDLYSIIGRLGSLFSYPKNL